MNDAIDHPEAARLVDSLVASGGGHVAYEFGAPGRQIAVAAGAHLAARTGMPLTVIDFRHLLPQVRTTVTELHPDLAWTPMSAGEAVQHPERNTGGVLVVHADLLHDPGTREALLAQAAAADRLIVASRSDTDASVLHTFPGPRFAVSARAPMPPVPPKASGPDIHRRFAAAIGTSYPDRFAELMASAAQVRTLPLWEGSVPVAPATWPQAAAVLEAFARSRPGTDEAAVLHAVASLDLALAPAGTGPVAGEYVRMENRKARGIAAIYGPGAGRGIDTIETALHRAETCEVNLNPYAQWRQISTVIGALQRVHGTFREQAGAAFPELWADNHVAGWWRQTSLAACARIADLGLQRAIPTSGHGGHPGVAALRDIGRAALVYTALAAPSTLPDLPGAPDLRAEAAVRAQNAERSEVAEFEAVLHEDTGQLLVQAEERLAAIRRAAEERATEVRDRELRGAQDRVTNGHLPRAPAQQDQRQATAHQQQGHQRPGLT
ncbi:hypothetical protein AB0E67_34265 [Streptomyces sp. NPDC032161]|uniref:hypothetical protein n=1 Tax=unclassified Streptomyces TaxID=2593676 RepID=UPI0033E910A2